MKPKQAGNLMHLKIIAHYYTLGITAEKVNVKDSALPEFLEHSIESAVDFSWLAFNDAFVPLQANHRQQTIEELFWSKYQASHADFSISSHADAHHRRCTMVGHF